MKDGMIIRMARWAPSFLLAAIVYAQQPPAACIENSLGIRLLFIPAGSFIMGSPYEQTPRQEDERPHRVIISKPFYLSETEITQQQWTALLGADKSFFDGDSLPVERVSWNEAVAFCAALSQKEGKEYRLPTEAEWEYACRAAGDSASGEPLDECAWYNRNSEETTHRVAGRKPNRLGLFDMLGNVAEWCRDYYEADYPDGPVIDPQGPEQGAYRVMRGGSWASSARACRPASRSDAPPGYQLKQTGFRILLEFGFGFD
ncbi:MAG TPA: SUMF1/EgtB/PvdO family nonheme iron enzyme [bacterium]|nr:SUMF1/EgtB/PvdO family nonheme iron enzyme [bacterium]